MTTKQKTRRMGIAANHVPQALVVLGELRRSLEDGKPMHVLLAHLDELQDVLLGMEDAVGVVTPATLF